MLKPCLGTKSRLILLKDDGRSNVIETKAQANNMNDTERDIFKLEEELTQTETRLEVDARNRIYADDIMVTAPIGSASISLP